jgi:hypothetical protein
MNPRNVDAYSYGSRGMRYFYEAYKLEEKEPQKALTIYEKALSLGLKKEFKQAAHWRLFYLYNSFHYYYESVRVFNLLGGKKYLEKIEKNLKKEMKEYFVISEKDIEIYMEAMGRLHLYSSAKIANYLPVFQDLLLEYQRNWNLYRDMVRALHKYKKAEIGLTILAKIPGENAERDLMKADLLIFLKKYEASYNLLREWGSVVDRNLQKYFYDPHFFSKDEITFVQREMEPGSKAVYFYLLGTIFKKWQKPFDAALQFLLAARFAQGTDSVRYRTLASFILYKSGELDLAYNMILKIPRVDYSLLDPNINLLFNILEYEKSKDVKSKDFIIKLLTGEGADKYSKFLIKRSAELLR